MWAGLLTGLTSGPPGSAAQLGAMAELILATEALSAGLVTRRQLSARYSMVYRNVYGPRGADLDACDRAVAAWMWSGRRATVAGASAAALLGSRWVPADGPAELTRTQYRAPSGIVVHTGAVREDEVAMVDGISCTTAARTAYDLGRRLPLALGLIRVDALLNATRLPISAIAAIAERNAGARHIRRLRRLMEFADGGAESPQESRLRLVLIRGGLPRPVTQIPVVNGYGRVRRRIDMGWPQWKVGVEYDGAQHWTDPACHADDIDRLEFLADQGWRIVRVSGRHLRFDSAGVVARAAAALRAAGWDPRHCS